MSGKWLALSLASFVIAGLAIAGGYWLPQLLPFTENILAETAGLFTALGLVVILIEGRLLTEHARRRTIATKAAKSVLELASEIGMMLTWEFGTWLVSALDSPVDLEGEERGNDWDKDIKPLLRLVYDEAERVEEDAKQHVEALSYEDHKAYVEGVKHYAVRVRDRMEVNLEVHEMLLELDESFGELEKCLTQAMWVTVRSEADRFHSLGRIGNSITRCMETIGRLHDGL